MEIIHKRLPVKLLELNKGQIDGLPANPRLWDRPELERLKKSLTETPELYEARGILCVPHGKKYVVLGGNMRLEASKELKFEDVPCCIYPEDMPIAKMKEIVIKDNGSFGQNDYEALANEWDDLPLTEWGIPVWNADAIEPTMDDAEIARKEQEFKDRMAAGEISEEDEEYQEFLEKFKLKKTTDDCYTPSIVYDAVADWVAKEYNISKARFVRPFYPGGDYQKENYAPDAVVVDNPPFSILAEILKYYKERRIHFFLFAPTLTLFSSSSSSSSSALPCGVTITYENGASVNTSFLTDLEDDAIRLRSAPTLYAAVKAANDENLKELLKELPKYSYPHHIITAPFVAALSRLGIDFSVPVKESQPISQLDSQKESGKSIFGKGYIVSDGVFAEREKAEREKAERWELSDRERAIIAALSK